jgi:hypothetical protein
MADFQVKLTPQLVNLGTEGSLDTSVVNGVSIQRTMQDIDVVNGTDRKKVGHLNDGAIFDDVVGGVGSYPDIVSL